MNATELRKKFIDFFVSKGHVEIKSAPLIPENDPTVLFTTAGMHPLVHAGLPGKCTRKRDYLWLGRLATGGCKTVTGLNRGL